MTTNLDTSFSNAALRLLRYFGMSVSCWTNAQAHYERKMVKDEVGEEIERIRSMAGA